MRRNRQAEGEQILRDAETTLRECLLEILPEVAESGAPMFTNSHFNAHRLPKHRLSKQAEALLGSALACVEMREALGLPIARSVGRLFIEACEESESSNEHRRGPRKLAAALLESLKHVA
jgi:hypothetical protein